MLEVIKLARIRFSLPQKHVMVMTLYVPIIVMALGGLGTIMCHTFHVNTLVPPFCVLKFQNGFVIPYGKILLANFLCNWLSMAPLTPRLQAVLTSTCLDAETLQ